MGNRTCSTQRNYRTAGALLTARFKQAVRHYLMLGHSNVEAKRLALRDSEAMDVIDQNPDGTFRFAEPGDQLTATSEETPIAPVPGHGVGISAETVAGAPGRHGSRHGRKR